MEKTTPFDWQRMFVGDEPPLFLLEIAFRTAFLYVFSLLLIRTLGRRVAGQLSSFELIVVIALGSSIGDPMFQADVPLLHGMMVVAVLTGAHNLMDKLKSRSPKFEEVVELSPKIVIIEGVLILPALQQAKVAYDEVFMLLRQNDIENLCEVELGVLEATGHLTIKRRPATWARQGLPLFPPPENLSDAQAAEPVDEAPVACAMCGKVRLGGPGCENCGSTRRVVAI